MSYRWVTLFGGDSHGLTCSVGENVEAMHCTGTNYEIVGCWGLAVGGVRPPSPGRFQIQFRQTVESVWSDRANGYHKLSEALTCCERLRAGGYYAAKARRRKIA